MDRIRHKWKETEKKKLTEIDRNGQELKEKDRTD